MGIPADIVARLGEPKSLEGLSADDLKAIVQEYYERWVETESTKYDIEHDVKVRDMQIHELEMEVSDMRGKFIIPKLKKVHNFKLMGGDD
ncbi:troponin I [Lepeophtheirus salmonis]|uniref:Troponin Ilike [Metaseiulus occidentalis] n=1 Tax=Lepeophtheirus salmonis TaxID=72036 RepID=A0A0K2TUF3_LEPSM|nr:troponin I-like [Lepeophtheirus salmonis]